MRFLVGLLDPESEGERDLFFFYCFTDLFDAEFDGERSLFLLLGFSSNIFYCLCIWTEFDSEGKRSRFFYSLLACFLGERELEGERTLLFCLFLTGDPELEGEPNLFLLFYLGGLCYRGLFYICCLFGDYEREGDLILFLLS